MRISTVEAVSRGTKKVRRRRLKTLPRIPPAQEKSCRRKGGHRTPSAALGSVLAIPIAAAAQCIWPVEPTQKRAGQSTHAYSFLCFGRCQGLSGSHTEKLPQNVGSKCQEGEYSGFYAGFTRVPLSIYGSVGTVDRQGDCLLARYGSMVGRPPTRVVFRRHDATASPWAVAFHYNPTNRQSFTKSRGREVDTERWLPGPPPAPTAQRLPFGAEKGNDHASHADDFDKLVGLRRDDVPGLVPGRHSLAIGHRIRQSDGPPIGPTGAGPRVG